MKKKGAIELSIGTIVIIVLAMSMLILGMVLVKNIFSEPEFRITLEKCINESGEYDGYKCSDNVTRMPVYVNENQIENYTMTNGVFCYKNNNKWENKVCEDVEVEQMHLTKEQCISEDICGIDPEEYYETKILKEDISYKWIEENTDCYFTCVDGHGNLADDCPPCDRFVYGDYIIEVIK